MTPEHAHPHDAQDSKRPSFDKTPTDSGPLRQDQEAIRAQNVWPRPPVTESRVGLRVWQAICVLLMIAMGAAVVYMARTRWPEPALRDRCGDPNYHGAECASVQGRSSNGYHQTNR